MTENRRATPSAESGLVENRHGAHETDRRVDADASRLDTPAWIAAASCVLYLAMLLYSRRFDENAPPLVEMLGFYAVFMLAPALGLAGAWSMLKRRRYRLSLIGACCLMVPLFGPWFGLTLPLGIWLLLLLRRKSIQGAFSCSVERVPETNDDAEIAIAAAAKLDSMGDWDAAIALYRQLASRWPEHATYIDNCIREIERKKSTAGSVE